MLKNLTVLLIFLFLFIASCSDDNVVNDSSVSFGEIFYHKYYNPNQSLIAATYKQNIPVGNGKLFCDTLKITWPSYGGKVAVAEEPSTSTYSRLFVMNTDGSNIIEIPQNNVYPNYYMLSPAANKVLFSTVADTIYILPTLTGQIYLCLQPAFRYMFLNFLLMENI